MIDFDTAIEQISQHSVELQREADWRLGFFGSGYAHDYMVERVAKVRECIEAVNDRNFTDARDLMNDVAPDERGEFPAEAACYISDYAVLNDHVDNAVETGDHSDARLALNLVTLSDNADLADHARLLLECLDEALEPVSRDEVLGTIENISEVVRCAADSDLRAMLDAITAAFEKVDLIHEAK